VELLRRVFSSLEGELVGFQRLLAQAAYALVTRENLLVFSPPGTAKTLFAACLFTRIDGAQVFDTQMSKGTLAEELFGSIDTQELKRGRVIHNTHNTLVDADLAFIDEFFDANDMVLRALLGVFNERVFKKGSQLEQCPLHTGIAAANYLRATAVTEAVLDRFLFRAHITPDYSPATLLAIDQAFSQHYGRHSAAAGGAKIPLGRLSLLAELVRGELPDRQVTAAPHVLFLKNVLLGRYRALVSDSSEHWRNNPLYISPRTYAKCRLVLNAAAVLRGRMEVSTADLAELRYAVTTIGGRPEQSQCFEKALRETMLQIRGDDLRHIDDLSAAMELAEQMMSRFREGRPVAPDGLLPRILRLFGLISEGDVTFAHVRRFVEDIRPRSEDVAALKLGVLGRIQELTRRIDYPQMEFLS